MSERGAIKVRGLEGRVKGRVGFTRVRLDVTNNSESGLGRKATTALEGGVARRVGRSCYLKSHE